MGKGRLTRQEGWTRFTYKGGGNVTRTGILTDPYLTPLLIVTRLKFGPGIFVVYKGKPKDMKTVTVLFSRESTDDGGIGPGDNVSLVIDYVFITVTLYTD